MSIAFIPIETSQELFNNKVVSEKWTQLVEKVTSQLSTTLNKEYDPVIIGSILQETLEEHYTLQQPSTHPSKEKKQERTQCSHILKNNKQCPNKANIGTTACTRHSK